MTPEQIAALVGLLTILAFIANVSIRLGRAELKIDTIWDFQMRRAFSEGIQSGVATMNSPLTVTDEAKAWMRGMAGDLKAFYQKLGRQLSYQQLALEIEQRFGDRIMKEVCIPHGLYQGACLLIAMEVAKELVGEPPGLDV